MVLKVSIHKKFRVFLLPQKIRELMSVFTNHQTLSKSAKIRSFVPNLFMCVSTGFSGKFKTLVTEMNFDLYNFTSFIHQE